MGGFGGGSNMSLPFEWVLGQWLNFDGVVVCSIADLSEEGVLGVVGLNAALPRLVTDFIRA